MKKLAVAFAAAVAVGIIPFKQIEAQASVPASFKQVTYTVQEPSSSAATDLTTLPGDPELVETQSGVPQDTVILNALAYSKENGAVAIYIRPGQDKTEDEEMKIARLVGTKFSEYLNTKDVEHSIFIDPKSHVGSTAIAFVIGNGRPYWQKFSYTDKDGKEQEKEVYYFSIPQAIEAMRVIPGQHAEALKQDGKRLQIGDKTPSEPASSPTSSLRL